MKNFADRLHQKIQKMNNPTVLGLDPMLDYVPDRIRSWFLEQCDDPLLASGLALFEFNRRLIDQVADIIPAVKPQMAYYEQYGVHGIEALRQTIAYARKKDMLIIIDGKRNDIGSTAQAYARAYLGRSEWLDGSSSSSLAGDALTVNAYLGSDGIMPFIDSCREEGKGVFILVRTSNASASELQDLQLADGRPLYAEIARLVDQWGQNDIGQCGYSSVGAVVGATWPQQAAQLRQLMPRTFILVPGYGAQGATAADTMPNFSANGDGAIVNASRSLMCAWKKQRMDQDQFDLASRQEALQMRQALQQALQQR